MASQPKPVRILVVDDNEDMRLSLQLILERAGYEVGSASDGERALALQRRDPAQILLTDIFMPDTDGLETIQRYRKEFPGVRIVAMSGGASRMGGDAYLQTARLAGADATLRKPFEKSRLLQTLDELISRPA